MIWWAQTAREHGAHSCSWGDLRCFILKGVGSSEKSSSFNQHSVALSGRLPFHFATVLGLQACSQVFVSIRTLIVFLLGDHLHVLMPGASIISRKSEVGRRCSLLTTGFLFLLESLKVFGVLVLGRTVTWKLGSSGIICLWFRSCLNFFYPWCAWSLRYFGGSYGFFRDWGDGILEGTTLGGWNTGFSRILNGLDMVLGRFLGCNFGFKAWGGHALIYCKSLGETCFQSGWMTTYGYRRWYDSGDTTKYTKLLESLKASEKMCSSSGEINPEWIGCFERTGKYFPGRQTVVTFCAST